MSRRKLTEEEAALWRKVAEKTDRLHPAPRPAALPGKPKPKKTPQPPASSAPAFEPFTLGSRARPAAARHDLKPALAQSLAGVPVQMDKKLHRRMKAGKVRPEGKLDLHGMRLDSAHPALLRFVLAAHAKGKRMVLVITGKGKDRDEPGPMPVPRGVLRHNVPRWLQEAPLSQVVMQVTTAHVSHGGDGAYYVYLRRGR